MSSHHRTASSYGNTVFFSVLKPPLPGSLVAGRYQAPDSPSRKTSQDERLGGPPLLAMLWALFAVGVADGQGADPSANSVICSERILRV